MMKENPFHANYGVMVALDTSDPREIEYIVDICDRNYGVVAIKVGSVVLISYGLPAIRKKLREMTDLPLIYDHQKMGVCPPAPDYDVDDDGIKQGESFGRLLGESKVDGGIIYPLGGPRVQDSFTNSFRDNNVEPFLLGRFTCDGHLQKEGGVFSDDVPERIYSRAAESGVEYYIMPGNRPEETEGFVNLVIEKLSENGHDITPKICLPGFGEQGGSVKEVFKRTQGLPSYAIIGPMDCFDPSKLEEANEHVKRYCDEAMGF